jgi:hypothetical protein
MATPKLALIPASQGTKLYSVLPANGVGDFAFTRGSSATRINSQGLIETVASGVSRLNYPLIDGVVNGCPSHLLEPTRSNFITYSTLDFNGGVKPNGWSIGFGTGTYSYEQLEYKGQKAVKQTQITTGRSYLDTGSITILANTEHNLKIQFILDECIADANDIICSITGFGIGQLITFSDIDSDGILNINFTSTSTTIGNIRIGLGSSSNEDGGKSLAWAIPQLEQGSYATSYIPTTTSAVTRSAETANGAGDASTFNDSEGVLFAEISALADDVTSKRIVLSNGNSSNNRVIIEYDEIFGLVKFWVTGSGTTNGEIQISGVKKTELNKISVLYKTNVLKIYINGFNVGNGTGIVVPTGLDNLKFEQAIGGNNFYGNTKQIQYYDSALNDSDLEKLTSWTSFRDIANSQQYSIK